MKEQEKVFREIKKVTRELIRCGLAEEYNYPVIQQMDIVWEKYQNISLYLRNMDYSTIYDEIEKNHNYNVKLPHLSMVTASFHKLIIFFFIIIIFGICIYPCYIAFFII